MTHTYFVSYHRSDNQSFSNGTFKTENLLDDESEVAELERYIEEGKPTGSVAIVSFQLLNSDNSCTKPSDPYLLGKWALANGYGLSSAHDLMDNPSVESVEAYANGIHAVYTGIDKCNDATLKGIESFLLTYPGNDESITNLKPAIQHELKSRIKEEL